MNLMTIEEKRLIISWLEDEKLKLNDPDFSKGIDACIIDLKFQIRKEEQNAKRIKTNQFRRKGF